MSKILVRGLRVHNLKNIDVDIPNQQLVVITGVSGSGKSSLAFDSLYAEGQRRYVESLSAYARQFLSVMGKPDMDSIEGLSPAIAIEQKATSHNPRSTVGTITELYDYLRLLYARVGQPRCPTHDIALSIQSVSQMVEATLSLPEDTATMILSPIVRSRKGTHDAELEKLRAQGFVRARIDGKIYELENIPALSPKTKHSIELVVDRLKVRPDIRQRLAESFETALDLSGGLAVLAWARSTADLQESTIKPSATNLENLAAAPQGEHIFSAHFVCPDCGYSLVELEPRLFSFNNPAGACRTCSGLGQEDYFDPKKVVHYPAVTLLNGAIRGWDRRNVHYSQLLTCLAKHYAFDINTPFNQLSEKLRHIILYGSGKEEIDFYYTGSEGRSVLRSHPFEGVIPSMQRRYGTTQSEAVHEELSRYLSVRPCTVCHGTRLCQEARHVFVGQYSLPDIVRLSVEKVLRAFTELKLTQQYEAIAERILKEVRARLVFLCDVGLQYLTLDRGADTLSGGEMQRIRLAGQIGSGLVGVMYVLDEPSIGLHQRDNARLLKALKHLRELGNTVILVEHDEEAILQADHVIDMGPGAGVYGGQVVAEGSPSQIQQNSRSLTGQYLSGTMSIPVPKQRLSAAGRQKLRIRSASCHNLKHITVSIPLGLMTGVVGVSGSGKSSLINDTLYAVAAQQLNKATVKRVGAHEAIDGLEYCDKVVDIDQSPIGRTPRSNPATYTGLLSPIRELFAGTPEARARGYKPGRFSFNVAGGRCTACSGDGMIKVEMHFLSDMYVMCDVCKNQRYNDETLEIKYKGKNIYQVLSMTVEEAYTFFEAVPIVAGKLKVLKEVGLSYITLGQSATTLSGGEAQRIKLAKELSRRSTGKTLYILDEPTTGLHFHDVKQLLHILMDLRDQGNTIVLIEHNMDVIKLADWIIELGPEGGDAGGELVFSGTPEQLAEHPASHTGRFLKKHLNQ